MSITTTIKVGETGKTITLPEGKALTIKPTVGSIGTAGVAYLLDLALGGNNSKGSWPIGSAALAPIGPYEGTQKILITCTAGSIDATVGDAAVTATQTVNDISGKPVKLASGSSAMAFVPAPADAVGLVSKFSANIFDFGDPAATIGTSGSFTHAVSKEWQRYGNYSRKLTITGASAVVIKTNASGWSYNLADKLIDIHTFLPDVPNTGSGGQSINVTISHSTTPTNADVFSFNSNYLKQQANILRCWGDETINDGTADDGTFEATTCIGSSRKIASGGTGMDWTQPIRYIEIAYNNFTGRVVYLDSVRTGFKVKSILSMGWDATSNGPSDYVMRDKVAPMCAARGYKGYFTYTWVYDALYSAFPIESIKTTLYNQYGWDAINHTYNHGASTPGFTKVGGITGTAVAATDLTTLTWTGHGYPVGSKFWTSVAGASPAAANGIVEITVTNANQLTYTAPADIAADGALTGTITLDSRLEKVLVDTGATSLMIARREIQDVQRLMQGSLYTRAIHIGAWPNNSAPDANLTKIVSDEVGIRLWRGIRGGTIKMSEFGLTSPLNMGSVEMGSGTTATSLRCLILKLKGAIGRGEHMWTYGHYMLDEKDPANAAHVNANTDYPPGSNGNPAPPGAAAGGGYWYLGQFEKFLIQGVDPEVAAGTLRVMPPSEFAINVGYGK